jgi:hypothetical protein
MKYNRSNSFLAGTSFAVTLLLHGFPQALAFAQRPTTRFSKSTTIVKQSSRSLFSPSEACRKDEKQFQGLTELLNENQRQETSKDDKNCHRMRYSMPNNIKLLQNPVFSGLDRGTAVFVTATSFLAVLTLCTLLEGGRIAALFRQTTWWFQFLFNSYRTVLISNPLSTKVGTGAVLAVLGDALAQSLTNGGAPYDKRRAASFAVFDSCYRVFQHNIFPAVIALCQGSFLGRFGVAPSIGAAVERTMVYQLMIVPVSDRPRHAPTTASPPSHSHLYWTVGCVVVYLLSSFLCLYKLHPGAEFQAVD